MESINEKLKRLAKEKEAKNPNMDGVEKLPQYRGNSVIPANALYPKNNKGLTDIDKSIDVGSKGFTNKGVNYDLLTDEKSLYDFGDALEFDGVDDYVSFSVINYNQYTVSYWFKMDVVENVTSHLTNISNASVFTGVIDSTTFRVRFGATINDFTVPEFSDNTWYHILYAGDGSNVRLFINGVESSTGALPDTFNFAATQFGRYATGGVGAEFFDGQLDDLLITDVYDDPAAEATAIYNGGAGIDPSTVIASPNRWYKFNGNGGDSGSDGANFTLNNFIANPYVPHT